MKLIELHTLQSFPVSCLNRDDVGSPKTAVFGGVTRARISSQCLKRAARCFAREQYPEALFNGMRSRRIAEPLMAAFTKAGLGQEDAARKTDEVREALSKIDAENNNLVKTSVFLSPGEIEQIAVAVVAGTEPKKALKKVSRLDAADISLFGRMIANDSSLNIEATAQFSHALSVHESANDIDFFSSVDDAKTAADEDNGAGMIGTLEFNSALYYRYIALNVSLLEEPTHLGELEPEKRRAVVGAFLRAALLAVPSARKASMNAATLPGYVMGITKTQGQPTQLINAFLRPIQPDLTTAQTTLKTHLENLKRVWGIEQEETELAEDGNTTLEEFIASLTKYVS